MAIQCKHNSKLRLLGLCKPCSELDPYTVFVFKAKYGYMWGRGYYKEHPDCDPSNEAHIYPYWVKG